MMGGRVLETGCWLTPDELLGSFRRKGALGKARAGGGGSAEIPKPKEIRGYPLGGGEVTEGPKK